MGHCINIFLGKKKEMTDPRIKYVELGSGIVAILDWPGNRSGEGYDSFELKKNRAIANISTDYFGGCGSQSAEFFVNGTLICDFDSDKGEAEPINRVLRQMGVEAEKDMDEFDTVGLGHYRSNRAFNEETDEDLNLGEEDEDFSFVEAKMSDEGFDYCFRDYSSFDDINDDKFHELRKAYIEAANNLQNYVKSKTKE